MHVLDFACNINIFNAKLLTNNFDLRNGDLRFSLKHDDSAIVKFAKY